MSDTKLYEEIDEYAREHKTVEFGEWSAEAFAMHKEIERLRDVDVQCGLYSYENDLLRARAEAAEAQNEQLRCKLEKVRAELQRVVVWDNALSQTDCLQWGARSALDILDDKESSTK